MNPSTTGLTIRFRRSPKRSQSLLSGDSSAGAARVMTRNTIATINDHQRIAWPETSGHMPITRNTTVKTQPKPRLLDDLTAWVLEKSSCVAIVPRSSIYSATDTQIDTVKVQEHRAFFASGIVFLMFIRVYLRLSVASSGS